jgi:hypothetical protein
VLGNQKRIVRFFGAGELIVVEPTGVAVCEAAGGMRFRVELNGVVDAVVVGVELWIVAHEGLVRVAIADGKRLGSETIEGLHPAGRFMQSSTLPSQPVWHHDAPLVISVGPGRAASPGPNATIAMPVLAGRWLLWNAGRLRYWRTGIGEGWRQQIGDPTAEAIDAQLVLDGRLLVLVQRRGEPNSTTALRLTVAQTSDGAQNVGIRLMNAQKISIAARSGLALTWAGQEGVLFNLRFGRWDRKLALPSGLVDIVVDEMMDQIALVFPDTIEIASLESLAVGRNATASVPLAEVDELAEIASPVAETSVDSAAIVQCATTTMLPDKPLLQLEPVSTAPVAELSERRAALELQLALMGALANVAIATAWDEGRIVTAAPERPPFAEELNGLLRITHGLRATELSDAYARLSGLSHQVDADLAARQGRTTPIEALARDFGLSTLASHMLVAIAAPRLRGEFARVYGILANDPGRPLVDEHLLSHLIGEDPQLVAKELAADRPLCMHGLVHFGAGTRPFAALSVEPLVVSYLTGQDLDSESDEVISVRRADRQLAELDVPHEVLVNALNTLSAAPDHGHARIAVRGRTGSGRHTLLATLAALVGRHLGVIDMMASTSRDTTRMAATLTAALHRAKLRGLVPCVDGIDLIASDDPDLRRQLAAVLRRHPGPVTLRVSAEARPPFDPGYLQLDLPTRTEHERMASWTAALQRHSIGLTDASDLAARYRVGPGTIEKVCIEVSRQPTPPADAAAWLRTLDEGVRQHLVARIGDSATRVTHLATWADVVLPGDISDSLLELTSRVRNRKVVFENWGFARSITSARGITALFQGSPGTGKTMVAGVIARELGLELYRVDVSRITSKWIGETEKNLGALFDAAEEGQVMLLFDEADSLFAKRTEVKSSVDRYANQEVNYLLQRFDSFEGVAILTTNFGNSIDSAFKRRLTYRVTFPFPDEEMRAQLWKSLLPTQVPTTGTLDFTSLAQRFRLSGGYIRNAVLRAAFLAADQSKSLTQDHLERAIRMEFRENGKLSETGSLE